MIQFRIAIAATIVNCLCAVVWDIGLLIMLTSGYLGIISFVFHILCTVFWNISAVVWIKSCIKIRKQPTKTS